MSAWIECVNKLPPIRTSVLIMLNGVMRIGEIRIEYPTWEETFRAYRYWDDPINDGQVWEWNDVTHCMPLPAPPSCGDDR